MSNQAELKTIEIKANGVQAGNTIRELAKATRDLRKELNTLAPTSEEFVKKSKRLREVTDRLTELRTGVTKQAAAWAEFKKQASSVMIGLLGGSVLSSAISGIVSFVRKGINGVAKLSDELSNIKKVTSLTSAEVLKLNRDLSKIETRTATSKLRDLAVAAGKLGIDGRRDLLEFVKAADKIQIALGEDLGEEALISIGKLVNVYKVNEKFGLEHGMLKVASSINSVGQASEASEVKIVDFLNQVGGTGDTVGVTIDELVGLAGALDSLGLTAEVSATAYKDNIIEFVRDTETWAKIAGYRVGELTDIIRTEGTNEAFLQFVTKLREGAKSEQEFLEKLKELKIDGSRGANVFLTIANNIKYVREQQDLSNKSFKEGTSIAKEAAEKQANTAALFEKAGKRIEGFLLGNVVTRGIVSLTAAMAKLIVPTERVSDAIRQEAVDLGLTEMKINDVNTSSEERIKLIEELKRQYPGYLGNVDAETVSNDALSKTLQQINTDLINRMVVQKALEKQTEKQDEIAAKRLKILQDEEKIRSMIAEKSVEQGFKIKPTGTLQGDVNEFNKQYDFSNSGYFSAGGLQNRLNYINEQKKALQNDVKELENYQNEAKRIAKSLGVVTDPISAKGGLGAGDTKKTIAGDSSSGLNDEEKKKQEKAADDYIKNTKKLLDDLRKLKVDAIKDEEEREIAKLKLAEELSREEIKRTAADAKTKADLIKAGEENLQTDITALRKKYADERTKIEYEATLKSLNDNYAQERIILTKKHLEGETTEKEYSAKLGALDLDYLNQKLTAAKDYKMDTLEIEQQILDGKIKLNEQDVADFENALNKKMNAELAAAKLRVINTTPETEERMNAELALLDLQLKQELELFTGTEEEKALIRAQYREQEQEMIDAFNEGNVEKGIDMANFFSNKYFDIQASRLRNQEAMEDKKLNQGMKRLDDQLKAGILSEEEYTAAKTKLEAEYNERSRKIKREQFANEKAANIISATMNTAVSVTKQLANPILAAIIAGLGLAQIALIARQPVPEFERGTVLGGASHANGGVDLYSKSGYYYGNAEKDEIIMTKGVYRDPVGRKLASDLNQRFGGVRFDGYNTMTAPPKFEFGSVITGGGYKTTMTGTGIAAELEQRITTTEDFLLQIAREISIMKATPLQAYISYDMQKRQTDDLQKIQKS